MPSNRINILFVDDEEQFLESMKKRLEARGFLVTAVNRGIKAIDAARRNPADIAILDLKMPGMNGNELLQILKKEHPWIEVIILTGHGGIDEEFQSVLNGAYAYLRKPCSLEDVVEALSKAYRRRLLNRTGEPESRLDGLIDQGNPQKTLLGALQAMKKLDTDLSLSQKIK